MIKEFTIKDRVDEFRVAINGRFAGDCVRQVEKLWKGILTEARSRRFAVDISRMSAFDLNGRKILREMYHHGALFAASTPRSLVFLNEISAPRRRATLMPEPAQETAEAEERPVPLARVAAGGK